MLQKIRAVILSPIWLLLSFLIAAVGIFAGECALLPAMIALSFVVAVSLFVCDDLFPSAFPALCLILLGTVMLQTLSDLFTYLFFGIPMLAGLFFHLIYYRDALSPRRFRPGPAFFGFAVAGVAILLGGIGFLSPEQYFAPTALYYTLGLSVAPLALYYVFSVTLNEKKPYDPADRFQLMLLLLGWLCVFAVLHEYLNYWTNQNFSGVFLVGFSYRNTIANTMMLCLPSGIYLGCYATKQLAPRVFCIVSFFVIYLAMLMTTARTAFVFGSLLAVGCAVFFLCSRCRKTTKIVLSVLAVGFAVAAFVIVGDKVWSTLQAKAPEGFWVDDARTELLLHSLEDFRLRPLFGTGLGDLHSVLANGSDYRPGCIGWYHSYFPQVLGSTGIFGCLAFAAQFFLRGMAIFRRPDAASVSLTLSYLGLFLYSQTDPGEFIPVPFMLLSVAIFCLLDRHYLECGNEKAPAEKDGAT